MQDKVALVSGGGSGIGRETSLLFASEGASVIIADLDSGRATETAAQIISNGGHATQVIGDVSKPNDAKRMVEVAIDAYGKLEVLVNSAGISVRQVPDQNASPDQIWDRVLEVNLKGTYLLSWHAVPEMRRSGSGSIVNIGSIASLTGLPAERKQGFDPYPASKGGVLQLTRSLAVELALDNIRVNCICPGHVYTDLTEDLTNDPDMLQSLISRYPIRRLGQPREIAAAALFLASDEASFVTGVPLPVDGGYTAQ